jgi:hypothetical protein
MKTIKKWITWTVLNGGLIAATPEANMDAIHDQIRREMEELGREP